MPPTNLFSRKAKHILCTKGKVQHTCSSPRTWTASYGVCNLLPWARGMVLALPIRRYKCTLVRALPSSTQIAIGWVDKEVGIYRHGRATPIVLGVNPNHKVVRGINPMRLLIAAQGESWTLLCEYKAWRFTLASWQVRVQISPRMDGISNSDSEDQSGFQQAGLG